MGQALDEAVLDTDEQYQRDGFADHLSLRSQDLEIDHWDPKIASIFGVEIFLTPDFANIEAWLSSLAFSMDFHDRDVLEVLDLVYGNDFSNHISWWRRGPRLIRNDINESGYRFGILASLPDPIDYIDFKFWQPWPGVVIVIAQCGLNEQTRKLLNTRLEKPLDPYFVPTGQSQGLVGSTRTPFNQQISLISRTIDEVKSQVRGYLRQDLKGLFHRYDDLHDMVSFVDLIIHNGRNTSSGRAGFRSLEWLLGLECGPETFGLANDNGIWFNTRRRGRDTPARLRANRQLYARTQPDSELGSINDFQISDSAQEQFFEGVGLNAIVVALECLEGALATLSREVHAIKLNNSGKSIRKIFSAEQRLADLRANCQYLRQDYVSEDRIISTESVISLWHQMLSEEQSTVPDSRPTKLSDEFESIIEHQVKSVNSRISILTNSVEYKSRALNQLQSSSLEQSNLRLQRSMLVLTLVLLVIALWPVAAWIGALVIDNASQFLGHFRR